MDEADFLAQVSVFSHMKRKDVQRIAKRARYQDFQAGELIIKEGDRDGQLFVIVTGEVEVIKNLGQGNQWRLQTLGSRGYFGEMALIGEWIRTASVVATRETRVLALGYLDLREEIERYPAIAIELLQMLSRRIQAIEKNFINALNAFMPFCASCNEIRGQRDSGEPIEEYIEKHPESVFSQSFCRECLEKLYSRIYKHT